MAATVAVAAFDLGLDAVQVLGRHAAAAAGRWFADGLDRHPALFVSLVAVGLVPLLALAALILRQLATSRRRHAATPEPVRTELAAARGLGWPCDAWLLVDGQSPERRPLPREMLSIGRDEDNDLRLDDGTVHRHHALLHRNEEAQFAIRDLSGASGNGVKVNGRRIGEAMLADGDRIEIGRVVLKFEARPA